jgi:hypothetical protein
MWIINLQSKSLIFFFWWFTKAMKATFEALETLENILSPQNT